MVFWSFIWVVFITSTVDCKHAIVDYMFEMDDCIPEMVPWMPEMVPSMLEMFPWMPEMDVCIF